MRELARKTTIPFRRRRPGARNAVAETTEGADETPKIAARRKLKRIKSRTGATENKNTNTTAPPPPAPVRGPIGVSLDSLWGNHIRKEISDGRI